MPVLHLSPQQIEIVCKALQFAKEAASDPEKMDEIIRQIKAHPTPDQKHERQE